MKRFLLALPALALLSACGVSDKMSKAVFGPSTEQEVAAMPDCPQTGVLPDANLIPIFTGQKSEIAAEGKLGDITGGCNFDEPGIADMEIKISFAARKTVQAVAIKKQSLPYFIAILSPDEQILQRQSFSTKIDFDNTDAGFTVEEHDLRVPVPSKEAAHSYKVVVGFELSPDQLGYNRKSKEQPHAD